MRIALLISGRGSTATAIINASVSGMLAGVTPVCVIASRPDATGIETVKAAGMPADKIYVVPHSSFLKGGGRRPEDFGNDILKICVDNKVDLIGQYGWMVKTPANVVRAFEGRMTNQHPGPLDIGRLDFGGEGMYGMRVHCARLLFVRRANRDFWSEASCQRVAVEFDGGAVLKARRVPILDGDTPETLAERMLPIEHEVEIDVLRDFVGGTVKEIKRGEPLVRPGEEALLEEVKKEAIMRYPKG